MTAGQWQLSDFAKSVAIHLSKINGSSSCTILPRAGVSPKSVTITSSVYCKSKIKGYNLTPCNYKATQEILIGEKIKEDTNIVVRNRADVNKIIKKFLIKSKFDFEIIYK